MEQNPAGKLGLRMLGVSLEYGKMVEGDLVLVLIFGKELHGRRLKDLGVGIYEQVSLGGCWIEGG